MNFGNPGNFGKWSTKDQFTFVKMYDESHRPGRKAGGGKNNSGCLSVIVLFAAAGVFVIKMLIH